MFLSSTTTTINIVIIIIIIQQDRQFPLTINERLSGSESFSSIFSSSQTTLCVLKNYIPHCKEFGWLVYLRSNSYTITKYIKSEPTY